MWDFFDKLEYEKNSETTLTYCEYIGGKVEKSNYGCEYGECDNCKHKEEYKSK